MNKSKTFYINEHAKNVIMYILGARMFDPESNCLLWCVPLYFLRNKPLCHVNCVYLKSWAFHNLIRRTITLHKRKKLDNIKHIMLFKLFLP